MLFALDSPAPSTVIILITAEELSPYAISALRLNLLYLRLKIAGIHCAPLWLLKRMKSLIGPPLCPGVGEVPLKVIHLLAP